MPSPLGSRPQPKETKEHIVHKLLETEQDPMARYVLLNIINDPDFYVTPDGRVGLVGTPAGAPGLTN